MTVEERLWSKVDRSGSCWVWTGYVRPDGYATMCEGRAKRHYAHRLAYELAIGPIPAGMEVDHLCHNEDVDCRGGHGCPHRRCVRPSHLQAVPHSVNISRGRVPQAQRERHARNRAKGTA